MNTMIWTRKPEPRHKRLAAYRRGMLRSAFVSLFWNILQYKKRTEQLTQKDLAERIGIHKSNPSKWFSGDRPNWSVDTIADISAALGVTLDIRAIDKATGVSFNVSGIEVGDLPARGWLRSQDDKSELDKSNVVDLLRWRGTLREAA